MIKKIDYFREKWDGYAILLFVLFCSGTGDQGSGIGIIKTIKPHLSIREMGFCSIAGPCYFRLGRLKDILVAYGHFTPMSLFVKGQDRGQGSRLRSPSFAAQAGVGGRGEGVGK
jgi:hypothetical protein